MIILIKFIFRTFWTKRSIIERGIIIIAICEIIIAIILGIVLSRVKYGVEKGKLFYIKRTIVTFLSQE